MKCGRLRGEKERDTCIGGAFCGRIIKLQADASTIQRANGINVFADSLFFLFRSVFSFFFFCALPMLRSTNWQWKLCAVCRKTKSRKQWINVETDVDITWWASPGLRSQNRKIYITRYILNNNIEYIFSSLNELRTILSLNSLSIVQIFYCNRWIDRTRDAEFDKGKGQRETFEWVI